MHFKGSVVEGILFLTVFTCYINFSKSEALRVFGFDVHHRYSDVVRDFLDTDGLPEKGTLEYYTSMANRDYLFQMRRLGTTPSSDGLLTFLGTNQTILLNHLGFLHYAIAEVGTPPLKFLVALDTGSDLFWLPCDCISCVRNLITRSGKKLDLNIYSPSTSSTSMPVPCNSTNCGLRRACAPKRNACAYQEVYLSANTSSTGTLVDDVLYLGTDADPQKSVDVTVTLGCGIIQTGGFVDGGAINGLFGLGMDNVSVPSTLANKGLAADSFSMCFGPEGLGRIDFGDKGGSPGQNETPFNLQQLHRTYNITVTQITMGNNVSNLEFTAVFDSGTSFTYLSDPVYSAIVESFDLQVTESRYQPDEKIIFNYCYELSANQDSFSLPNFNLTMKGGSQFFVTRPIVIIPRKGGNAYCLAIVNSSHHKINIIGQNFMTGYRIVFNREEMVLGWKESDCYDSLPSKGSNALLDQNNSTKAPAPSVMDRTPTHSPASSPLQAPPFVALPGSTAMPTFDYDGIKVFMLFFFFIVQCFIGIYC